MRTNLFSLSLVIYIFSLLISVKGQNEDYIPISSTDKFNYRGYLNGNVFVSNASESISEYDGNLLLAYEYFPNLPEHLKSSITLTYNANVTHVSRIKCGGNTSLHPQYINHPEWIIGFRGFALQVLNFENNYYGEGSLGCGNPLQGSEVSLLIPGYHYTNKQDDDFGYSRLSGEPPFVYNNHDMIRLLMADGSIKYLFNLLQSHTTGTYLEGASPDRKSFAFVESNDFGVRTMYYKNGDGFTYIFEEEDSRLCGIGGMSYTKTMYLKKAISNVGDILSFDYFVRSAYGRIPFSRIELNRGSNGNGATDLPTEIFHIDYDETQFGWEDPKISSISLWINKKIKSTLWIDFNNQLSYHNFSRSAQANRILKVFGITDERNLWTNFIYTQFQRKYTYFTYATLITRANLITRLEYPSKKKTELEYYPEKFTGEYPNLELQITPNFPEQYICVVDNMTQAFRDCFTNFMVKCKKTYKDNILIKDENYNYSFDGTYSNQAVTLPYLAGIKTKIKVRNYQQQSSLPGEIWKTYYFSRYKTGEKDYTMQDQAFTIKMNWESISNDLTQESTLINYDWDTGNNFELISKTKKEVYNVNNQNYYEKSATTNFNRVFNTIHFGDENDINVIRSESVINPDNIISYHSFKNFWPQSPAEINKDFYYKLNSIDEVKDSSLSGWIRSKQKIEYFEDPGSEFFGLKKKEISFANSRPIVTNFEYFSTIDSIYHSLIKSIVYSNGVKKSFQYPKVYPVGDDYEGFWCVKDTQIVRVVSDQLIEKDSIIILSPENNCLVWNPIKIVTTDNNNNIFSSSQIINKDGELIYATDLQNILSSFLYDEKSRLTQAILPGNYSFAPSSTFDSTMVITNLFPSVSRFIENSSYSDCSTNTNSRTAVPVGITLSSRVNVPIPENEDDDSPTEIIKGDSETDELIGGGGGPVCNEYSRAFLMFADKIELKDAVSIQNATFNIQTSTHNAPTGQSLVFNIKGLTDSLGTNQTVGSIYVSFVDNTTLQINVATILEQIMSENKDLYGFMLSCTAVWIDENNRYKSFGFNTQTLIPNLICNLTRFDYYPKNFTSKYFYDDDSRIIDLQLRQGSGSLSNNVIHSKNYYDSFGNLTLSKIKNSSQQFEARNTSFYNSFNLNYKSIDGENRPIYTKYDYLSRPIEIRLDDNWGTGAFKKIEYLSTLDGTKLPVEQTTDEENKVTRKYFDKAGNLKKEERVDGSSSLITLYGYDDLSRLISVESPEHKITSYQYDDHSNISQKTSPDEGTTKFKYDKYGNLRLSLNTGATPTENALIFNKYDNFNRLITTGQLVSTYGFDLLDPDLDYSDARGGVAAFENYISNQGNFVLVNMYDKYLRTGVFANLPLAFTDSLTNLKGKLVATAFRDKTANTWSYKLYSYDYLGRVKDLYTFFQSASTYKKISNEYDNLGNLIKQNVDNQFYTWYNYDEQARLKEVRSNKNNAYTTAKLDAVYSYDKSDKVLSSGFGTYWAYGPRVLYTYDNKGRVSDINGIALDVFATAFQQTLTYYDNDNIHTMFLRNDGNGSWPNLNFTYSYDNYNRLTSSVCSNSYYTENYTYDNDGNLTHKNRPYNTSQSLTYNYTTPGKNYLMTLTKGGTNYSFTYDYKGNMLTDTRKSITTPITYDRRNLPIKIYKPFGEYYDYYYDDGGQRIYKRISSINKEYYLRDHTGKELAVYDWYTGKLKMLNLYGNGIFGKVNVSYDAQNARTDSRQYYIKDYLGSVRMTIDEKTFDIVSAQDYFPFGGIMDNRSYTTGGNINDKYKFTEKERDTETNYDYFGARYYDSELGRWLQVDPLTDKYPGWSSFNYCFNNPTRFKDKDGLWPSWIHNDIIDFAFEGIFSIEQRNSLKLASWDMDNVEPYKSNSFLHAMRNSDLETQGLAENQMNAFVYKQMRKYIYSNELYDLGLAMHSLMDLNSPTHIGFQIWNGNPNTNNLFSVEFNSDKNAFLLGKAFLHSAGELYITPKEKYDAAQKIKNLYVMAEYEKNKTLMYDYIQRDQAERARPAQ